MRKVDCAMKIAYQLREWIEEGNDFSLILPVVNIRYGVNDVLEIMIGNTLLWSSDRDDDEQMTLEYCTAGLLEELGVFHPFISAAAVKAREDTKATGTVFDVTELFRALSVWVNQVGNSWSVTSASQCQPLTTREMVQFIAKQMLEPDVRLAVLRSLKLVNKEGERV